jgi:hypothetical protein
MSTLPPRTCTAASPMRLADKDAYQWSHPEARYIAPYFNVARVPLFRCPHCGVTLDGPVRLRTIPSPVPPAQPDPLDDDWPD